MVVAVCGWVSFVIWQCQFQYVISPGFPYHSQNQFCSPPWFYSTPSSFCSSSEGSQRAPCLPPVPLPSDPVCLLLSTLVLSDRGETEIGVDVVAGSWIEQWPLRLEERSAMEGESALGPAHISSSEPLPVLGSLLAVPLSSLKMTSSMAKGLSRNSPAET